jgi:membrane associated rhomboid family serine protease
MNPTGALEFKEKQMLSDRDYIKTPPRSSHTISPQNTYSAVKTLIIVNVVVYFLQAGQPNLTQQLYIHPYFIKNLELWRIITSMFAHGGLMHLLFNMIVLWSFGPTVEQRIGKKRFFFLYFFAGFFSTILWLITNWCSIHPALGASGAICGILATVAIISPRTQIYFFFIPKAIPIRKFIVGYSIISVTLYLLRVFQLANPVNWAHMAHVGGILGGWLWISFFYQSKPKSIDISKWFSKFKADRKRNQFTTTNSKPTSLEVDQILDKISRSGLDSLTTAEKDILKTARNNLK